MLVRSPSTVRTPWISMPGESRGTRDMVRLLCCGASGSVLVIRKTYWQLCAPVVNIFEPLITHESPSRTARVLHVAMSEPPSGSVYPRHNRMCPLNTPDSTSSRISGLANLATDFAIIDVVPAVTHGT